MWMSWTMVNKMKKIDYGRWNEWDGRGLKKMRWNMNNEVDNVIIGRNRISN